MTTKRNLIAMLIGMLIAPISANAQLGDFVNKLTGNGKPNDLNPTKVIACFRLEGPLAETPTSIAPLLGGKPPLSLLDLLDRLKEARQDKSVTAVVLDVQDAQLGIGQWEEIHDAIRKFEAVDKQVFVHADRLTTLTYAAATSAAHISVVPSGDIWLTGLYSETPYLRGMLDKIGVVPDVEQCGNFKTGGEFITRKEPSEESKKMTKWLLDGLFDSMVERVAKSRKMTPAKLKGLIDNGPYSAEDALKAGLVDSVRYRQDFIKDLKARYGQAVKFVPDYGEANDNDIPQDFFAMMNWFMEMLNPSPKEYTEPSVAVVYVDGMIQDGEAEPSPFGAAEGAFSTTIRKALDEAADDGSVKAVVLRVDSPGGSALASEIIWNATQRVAARKPFVVSMGNVAGSGGYYVSCGAETIFADHTTITASIGVLSGKLVTTGGWEKLGIHWHTERRGEMAGILASATTFNDAERAKIRKYMEDVYGVFKKRVVDGRKSKLTKPIDEVAGGRVFSGGQALELGLIDQIGGLDDAIKFAAQKAGQSDYDIRVIPEPPSIFDLFMKQVKPDDYSRVTTLSTRKSGGFSGVASILADLSAIDPARVQTIMQALRGLEILQHERAALWMAHPAVGP